MKHRSVWIYLVLAAMLLAACGDGSGATTTAGGSPATTASETPATTAGGAETTAAPEVTTGELIPVRLQLQWGHVDNAQNSEKRQVNFA